MVGWRKIRGPLLIAAGFILPVLALRPLQNVPYVDDWTYAWAVENFLNTGTLKILDWSTSINVAQIVWGSLFAWPLGFSFTVLRLSTWVLSVLGLTGFYLLLQELGVSRRDRLIGTAVLAFFPWYLLFSFTFMTDIPAVTFTTWSLFFFIKGLNSGRYRWLLAASGFSILTIATRLTGLAIPAATAAFWIFHRNPPLRKRWAALIGCALPLLFAIALLYWHSHNTEYRADLSGLEGSPQHRTANLRFGIQLLYQYLLVIAFYLIAPLGVVLGPLAMACPKWVHRKKVLLAFAAVAFVFALGWFTGLASPASHGLDMDRNDLGESHPLVPGASPYVRSAAWVLLSGIAGVVLFCLAAAPALSRTSVTGVLALRWLLLIQFVLMAVLWLGSIRYLLMVVPQALALVLSAVPIHRPRLAVLSVGFLAVISAGVLHDDLEYNRALWRGVDHLRGAGAPLSRINGGYMVNGWLQYAHKDNARRDENDNVVVEWVNAKNNDFDYQISNRYEPGSILLKKFHYISWLGHSGDLYVLGRPAGEN